MGKMPCLSRSIFSGIISTQVTWLPMSARHVPVTRPTYPVPITQMIDTFNLLLYSDEWILEFLFDNSRWSAMPWKNDQVVFQRVQFFPNRCDNLFVVASL